MFIQTLIQLQNLTQGLWSPMITNTGLINITTTSCQGMLEKWSLFLAYLLSTGQLKQIPETALLAASFPKACSNMAAVWQMHKVWAWSDQARACWLLHATAAHNRSKALTWSWNSRFCRNLCSPWPCRLPEDHMMALRPWASQTFNIVAWHVTKKAWTRVSGLI